jgi:hypothetical protein
VVARIQTVDEPRIPAAVWPMGIARRFYLLAGVAFVVVTAIGFQEFYLRGQEFGGTAISPQMFPFVIVHGIALTAWVVLFLTQTVLISRGRRKIHARLGWCATGLGVIIVISGLLVAVRYAAGLATMALVFFAAVQVATSAWVGPRSARDLRGLMHLR